MSLQRSYMEIRLGRTYWTTCTFPPHFAADEQAVDDLLTHHGAADLITATPEGVVATMLPFVYDPGMRTLRGHLARNNDQWRRPVVGEALVIVRGPDAYISPAWYPSKAEHGRVVPTWNYVTGARLWATHSAR